jgi:hypothetical protein
MPNNDTQIQVYWSLKYQYLVLLTYHNPRLDLTLTQGPSIALEDIHLFGLSI